jgi:catechol 2,3-dioxygenase-like lactoylglutathione lyase family enzyme
VIDHFGFRVKDLKAARRFYDATMKALGLGVIDNTETSFLVGRSSDEPIPFLWIGTDQPDFWKAGNMTSVSPIHVAFQAGTPNPSTLSTGPHLKMAVATRASPDHAARRRWATTRPT